MRRTPEQVALLSRGMAGPLTLVERALDAVALLAIATTWLLPLVNLSRLTDAVPTHFDASGRPDAYGDVRSLFVLAAVTTGLWVLVYLTRRSGRFVNVPVTVTEENHVRVGGLIRQFLTVVGTVTVLAFAAMQVQTLRVALGAASGLGVGFTLALPFVFLGLLAGYMAAIFRESSRPSPPRATRR